MYVSIFFSLVLLFSWPMYNIPCPSVCVVWQSVDIAKWPFTVASYVGAGLLSRLMDTAKLSLDDSKLVIARSLIT